MQDSLRVLLVSAGVSRLLPSRGSGNGDQDIRPVAHEWHCHSNNRHWRVKASFLLLMIAPYCKKSYTSDSEISVFFSWELLCCGDGG